VAAQALRLRPGEEDLAPWIDRIGRLKLDGRPRVVLLLVERASSIEARLRLPSHGRLLVLLLLRLRLRAADHRDTEQPKDESGSRHGSSILPHSTLARSNAIRSASACGRTARGECWRRAWRRWRCLRACARAPRGTCARGEAATSPAPPGRAVRYR